MDTEDTKPPRFTKRMKLGLAAIALVAAGGTAGAIGVGMTRPAAVMAPMAPTAIQKLVDDGSIVTIKGRVAQVYGNKFVMTDGSANALVDTGRDGDSAVTVASGQNVTVQGRFDDGVVRASFLIGADGKVVALRGGKHGHGERGEHGHGDHDRRDDDGPRGGDGPSPMQPPTPPTATPAPVAKP